MDPRLLNEFKYLTGQMSHDQMELAENRRVVQEDPNNFFAAVRPYTGRTKSVDPQLMGHEQPVEDEDEAEADEEDDED